MAKVAVTSNTTGSVTKYGNTDFTGQFNPADYTQVNLNETAQFVAGVETYYHKVVAGDLIEMSAAEKTAVDVERAAISDAQLEGAARIGKKFANLAALPLPPPAAGLLVAIENVGGSWAFAFSTATGYVVFQASGTYP